MKRKTIAAVVLLLASSLIFSSCATGVSQEEYQTLVADLDAAQAQIAQLDAQIARLQTEEKSLEAEKAELTQQFATLSAKLQEETELAVIKLPDEVKLDVPFEPNLGQTCVSSSFAMVMRYWGKNVTVHDVLDIVGYPPIWGYKLQELGDWMEKNYGLRFEYFPNSQVEDLKMFLSRGCPVVVHQTFSLDENSGHDRVVIGYSDKQGVFIANDPSGLGPNYQIPYDVFGTLWEKITLVETCSKNEAYLVTPLK